MKQLLEKILALSPSALCAATAIVLMAGCTSAPRIYTDRVPAGSLRLAQVAALYSEKDIVENEMLRNILTASGIKETQIRDGSVGLGKVRCCGGPNEEPTATAFYVSPELRLKLGDFVEVRIGQPPEAGRPGTVNTVTRVRPREGVRWDPPDDRLWTRVLYADWMAKEGWIYQSGPWKTWYKPPP